VREREQAQQAKEALNQWLRGLWRLIQHWYLFKPVNYINNSKFLI
jgi:hypothetical protein